MWALLQCAVQKVALLFCGAQIGGTFTLWCTNSDRGTTNVCLHDMGHYLFGTIVLGAQSIWHNFKGLSLVQAFGLSLSLQLYLFKLDAVYKYKSIIGQTRQSV